MRDLLELLGAEVGERSDLPVLPVTARRVRVGDSLFHEGGPAEAVYFARSGTFKVFHTAEDGYEQVIGFVGRAEVLGFDALCTGEHSTAAIALEDSGVFAVRFRDLCSVAGSHASIGHVINRAVSCALTRQRELADVMAAVAAEVRLARFLLHYSRRMVESGRSPRRLLLGMGRRDIASYLGVAHETVSRSFKALAQWDLVTVDNREVEILDLRALRVFAEGTRRQLDDAFQACRLRPAPDNPDGRTGRRHYPVS